MAKTKPVDLSQLSDSDIKSQIDEIRRELFDLRFQQATRQLNNPHRFKQARVKLARLLTLQNERNRSVSTTS